jgi:hypothetical protein
MRRRLHGQILGRRLLADDGLFSFRIDTPGIFGKSHIFRRT